MAGGWTTFSGDAWRVEWERHKEFSADHSATKPGRWHRLGQTALYMSINNAAVVANAQVKLRSRVLEDKLRGGPLGPLMVREVRLNEHLLCAAVRRGPSAAAWELPETYPLLSGTSPGSEDGVDRVVPHARCQQVADKIRACGLPRGVLCTSAALNGHASVSDAEEICELDPVRLAERYKLHDRKFYVEWLANVGVNGSPFADVP